MCHAHDILQVSGDSLIINHEQKIYQTCILQSDM